MTTWVTPPTFSPNTFPTAATFNKLRDDLNVLGEGGCRLWRTGAWTATNDNLDDFAWDTEANDSLGMWNAAGDRAAITVPHAGVWTVTAQIAWAADAAGDRSIYILKNGILAGRTDQRARSNAGLGTITHAHADIEAVANDVIKVQRYQNSGGTLSGGTGIGSTWVSVRWVSYQ